MVGWGRPIVREPNKLWRVKDGGDNQFIFGVWMVPVLLLDHLLEVEDACHDVSPGLAFGQVIEALTVSIIMSSN